MQKKVKFKTQELLEFLESITPFSYQESWDNSGLIVGGVQQGFNKIYLSLEADREVLESLEEDSLLITHHPLIFSPLKQFTDDTYPTSLIKLALKKNIQLLAMHTNFDKTHFGKYIVENILGIKEYFQEGFIMSFEWEGDFWALCQSIKDKMQIKHLKVTQSCNKNCQKIALVTGSGASFIHSLKGIDCFITGDIKYHDAMIALERGIHLIDCGHYELESYFGEILFPILTKKGYEAIITNSKNPFNFV
ncbi:Nif3-like dinuclear metal center hexameric protein [Helicobacter mesocricetorum]|uniref:Nif3-like dinuclear metal center hexameric protein n=1 Tax=Helicobacter mesocricetorum TaxID=87012 RepID=UPI000CF1C31E|nr:Nif3-like dinuclear metal center hexameric protein [Helicobacter mesocricetorum]